MTIAQIYHDFSQRGGAERHVETLSGALSELGHKVTVVSKTPPPGFSGFVAEFTRWTAPVSALRLARWLRRERIQLVHAHSRISALIASLAVRLYRIPLVVTSHILPDGWRRISQWGDATICVSDAVRRRLMEQHGLPARRAFVIHNGVEMGRNADVAPVPFGPRPVISSFGPGPLISMVGRFAPGKGHKFFLRTATHLLANGFPGTFLLAGDGPLERDLRARYARDRIVFLGHRSDVPAIFAQSSASVVCSESEAFPYVVLESLAAGTPVISSDCGGPAEVIRPGRDGFLFPAGDSKALHRLLLAVSDAGLASREEISDECRSRFSRSRMVESTLTVYREVCQKV